MKDVLYYLKLGFVLLIISGIAAGILAFVNTKTAPIIAANQKKAEVEARREVLPTAKNFTEKTADGFTYFCGTTEADSLAGYTFIAYGPGYSSTIQTMVGVNPDFSIAKIKILFQAETPGLGANADKPDFTAQFTSMVLDVLAVDKDGGKVKSLTGATISSRAITNSIKAGLLKLQAAETTTAPKEETHEGI